MATLNYDFTDINQAPSNKVGLETIFNGINIDQLGLGVQTANVFGRGAPEIKVQSTSKQGADGAWLDDVSYEPRKITVEVVVESDDVEITIRELMTYLPKEIKELRFTDDQGYHYNALFTRCSGAEVRSRSAVLNLEFTCYDPYRYGELTIVTDSISENFMLPNTPTELKVTLSDSGAVGAPLKITNPRTGQAIVLDTEGSYAAGDVIRISWEPRLMLLNNTMNILPRLSLNGDYETFTMKAGDSLIVSPSGRYEIKIRDRRY